MGLLKSFLQKRIKASSLTEVIVATSILLLVFAITLVTLNNIMLSSVRQDSQKMQTQIEQLIYQYKNNQLKIPISYKEGDFKISIKKTTRNEIKFIEFSIINLITQKSIIKEQLFYDKK